MSQKKVDEYKKEKANRAKNMAREKRILMLERILGIVIVAAVVFWAGFSIYRYGGSASNAKEPEIKYTDVNMSALYDYQSTLTN